jgi:hypothetical protein
MGQGVGAMAEAGRRKLSFGPLFLTCKTPVAEGKMTISM